MRGRSTSHRGAAALLAALLAGGCGEAPAPEPHVYVVGREWVASPHPGVLWAAARLWIDGDAQPLADGTCPAIATGVTVSGGRVYVSGLVHREEEETTAVVWQDGTEVALTDGTAAAAADDVAVAEGEVYAVGYTTVADGSPRAAMWRNGHPYLLEHSGPSRAYDVTLSGGDVYVAGYEYGPSAADPRLLVPTARLWKNGLSIALGADLAYTVATAVAVSEDDVFVAGWSSRGTTSQATIWKNGVASPLTDGVYTALATGLAVDQGRVLASGAEFDGHADVAKVWRGGAPMDLTSPTSAGQASDALAHGVAAARGVVYAAGHHGARAVYWEDGVEVRLTDGSSDAEALAIAVVLD